MSTVSDSRSPPTSVISTRVRRLTRADIDVAPFGEVRLRPHRGRSRGRAGRQHRDQLGLLLRPPVALDRRLAGRTREFRRDCARALHRPVPPAPVVAREFARPLHRCLRPGSRRRLGTRPGPRSPVHGERWRPSHPSVVRNPLPRSGWRAGPGAAHSRCRGRTLVARSPWPRAPRPSLASRACSRGSQ
jgi:hypothetical protein